MKKNEIDDHALKQWLCSGDDDWHDALEDKIIKRIIHENDQQEKAERKSDRLYRLVIVSYSLLSVAMFVIMLLIEPLSVTLRYPDLSNFILATETVESYYPSIILIYAFSTISFVLHFFKKRRYKIKWI